MRAFRMLRGLVEVWRVRREQDGRWPFAVAAATGHALIGVAVLLGTLTVMATASAPALASPEADAYLGAQQRFTLDSQRLADRASLAVNVANGNLVVSASDLRIAGRQLGLSLSRTYNARGGGVVRTAGRDWVLSLGADNTLAVESDGDRTWRGGTGRITATTGGQTGRSRRRRA